ncbi:hypothetical protein BT63DRAFT_474631 [Microthyrium microscopicum]|uniref:Elongation factor 1-alpha n=1 Tax=Microthyrium microscopicum TaxID=703497 RepID=A0A6A6URN3_9PEZI|nr:hypothetical protein BT63DRAFT_474631 [Microthyrium microscopicum]
MSDLNSWEDDKDAQEESLPQQTQRMNLNNAQAPTFQPGAATFQPGAASFQPAYSQYQQYGGGYNQQQQYPQYGYGGYGQQGQQGQQAQQFQQYGGYNQQYGQYGYNQQQPNYNTQQAQQAAPVTIAQRPGGADSAQAPAASKPAADPSAAPKAKVLSIGLDSSAKVEKTGGTKVLSIGGPAPPKQDSSKAAPEAGNKVAAAKAIEKTGDAPAAKSSGKTSPAPSSGKDSPGPADKAPVKDVDAVAKEQEADVDESILAEVYGKEHVNVIFLGHVDAGKSTLGGSILYATGMVDERTMEKYKREAKEAGRETWYLSWALDLTKEERAKGKTVEVGRGFFETEKRRYSILDAPGHKTFVPSMIGGASQADVGVLVISARKGEYETGFEKGGQTREHAILAKTQGVNKLVVAVNKMDDPTVEWSEARYKECTTKLAAFLKGVGYNPKTDLVFMPISAQTTLGIKDRIPKDVCPWFDGPSLLEYLDGMQALERKLNAPLMMPIAAKYKDMGTMIEGKIEAGVLKKENTYLMMPNREKVHISALYGGETEEEIPMATCGEQVRLRLRGIEEEDIFPGFVLCSPSRPVHCVRAFEAQIVVLELRSILSAGFNCVLHVHSAQEEVTFAALLHKLEKGTGRKSKKAPGFATKGMSIIARLEVIGGAGSICVEKFEDYAQLGRFTLRDQGQTIAIGKITKLILDAEAE